MTQRVAKVLVLLSCFGPLSSPAQLYDAPYCQILDHVVEPVWDASIGYITREDIERDGAGHFGIVELNAGSGLVYLETDQGTFDLRTSLELLVLTGDGDIALPDQVGSFTLDLHWILRFPSGFAVKLGAFPGFYSDFEDLSGKDLFIPLEVQAIQAFNESVSGMVGLALFPGFDRVVDPRVGLRWGIYDAWLVDLFYPESRIAFAPDRALQVYVGIYTRPQPEFQLQKDDDRDRFMFDETRWFVGLDRALSGLTQLQVRAGKVINRKIDFENNFRSADVEDAFYLTVGIGGTL